MFVTNNLNYYFTTLDTPLDSRVLIAYQLSSEVMFTEIYKVDQYFPLQEKEFGIWSQQEGLVCNTESFLKRRSDFQGFVIKALIQSVSRSYLIAN